MKGADRSWKTSAAFKIFKMYKNFSTNFNVSGRDLGITVRSSRDNLVIFTFIIQYMYAIRKSDEKPRFYLLKLLCMRKDLIWR